MTFRNITYDGRNSLTDLGVKILPYPDSEVGDPVPRHNFESMPYRDGYIDTAEMGGKTYYDSRTLTYAFFISSATRAGVRVKAAQVLEWLAGKSLDLFDSDYPGYRFTSVRLMNSSLSFYSRNENTAKFTVELSAAPYLTAATGITTTLASGYGTLGVYIFENRLLCDYMRGYLSVDYPGVFEIEKIAEKTYQITLGAPEGSFSGIRTFAHLGFAGVGEMELESVSGAALYKLDYNLGDLDYGYSGVNYCGYGEMNNVIGGALRFTITLKNDVELGNGLAVWLGQAHPYSLDGYDHYYIDAYTAREPQITVNGEQVSPRKFSLPPDKPVSYVKASSGQTGMYVLGYDSVEKRL